MAKNKEITVEDVTTKESGALIVKMVVPATDTNKLTASNIHMCPKMRTNKGKIIEYKDPLTGEPAWFVIKAPTHTFHYDNPVEKAQAAYILQARDGGVFAKTGNRLIITDVEEMATKRVNDRDAKATLLIRVKSYIDDGQKVKDLANNLGIDVKANTTIQVKDLIYDEVENNPNRVLATLDSPDFELKSLIYASLDTKNSSLSEIDGSYFFGQKHLGVATDINKSVNTLRENPEMIEVLKRETGRA